MGQNEERGWVVGKGWCCRLGVAVGVSPARSDLAAPVHSQSPGVCHKTLLWWPRPGAPGRCSQKVSSCAAEVGLSVLYLPDRFSPPAAVLMRSAASQPSCFPCPAASLTRSTRAAAGAECRSAGTTGAAHSGFGCHVQ